MKDKILTISFLGLILASFSGRAFSLLAAHQQGNPLAQRLLQQATKGAETLQQTKARYQEAKRKMGIWRQLSLEEKQRRLEHARGFLTHGLKLVIAHLYRWQERIRTMKGVDEELRQQLLSDLKKEIEWLETQKQEAEGITDPKQVGKLAQTIQEHWRNSKIFIRRFVGLLVSSKVERLVERCQKIAEKLSQAIAKAEEEGKDVSLARKYLDQANQALAKANQNLAAAKGKFAAITSWELAHRLFPEGHQLLAEARKNLAEFRQWAYRSFAELKKLKGEKMEEK